MHHAWLFELYIGLKTAAAAAAAAEAPVTLKCQVGSLDLRN
jgi:hypothetical protein